MIHRALKIGYIFGGKRISFKHLEDVIWMNIYNTVITSPKNVMLLTTIL